MLADVKYELRPSPHHPLQVDLYGRDLLSVGQIREQLALDNGVVLTGRTYGGSYGATGKGARPTKLFKIEDRKIELPPVEAGKSRPNIDAAILGVVSSRPLVHGACARGVARPGFPFSLREKLPTDLKGATWSTGALRLHHEDIEITFVSTSNYWRKMVDLRVLDQDAIVGVRRLDHGLLKWHELDRVALLLSNFLGWINHCASPVFHIKGYRKGTLVYKGFNLQPYATVPRDAFSWLPVFGPNGEKGTQADLVQGLLNGFARVWAQNAEDKGVFHIALEMLRSRSKGFSAGSDFVTPFDLSCH